MRFVDEFRDAATARAIAERIGRTSTKPARFMEFCGSHTHALLRFGIRDMLPSTVEMRSGPGCPVCVTSTRDIDRAIVLATMPGMTVATYGDLVRVPGSRGSLEHARAAGADIRVVYSALDALALAEANSERHLVLIGIGFETTAPTVAASIIEAARREVTNYHVFSLLKRTPPVMEALLSLGDVQVDGILCPGHVSVITGTQPYETIPSRYGIGCAISGFEPLDILRAIEMLVQQFETDTPVVANAYERVVTAEGNRVAQELLEQVFDSCAAEWRGLGWVEDSGLSLRAEFAPFDAAALGIPDVPRAEEPAGCRCGDVLRGSCLPEDCTLFATSCTPQQPVGPCMVSHEGSCAAHFAYYIGT